MHTNLTRKEKCKLPNIVISVFTWTQRLCFNNNRTGEKWSLANFSIASADSFAAVPTFHIFRYALAADYEFLGGPIDQYADSFIQSSFLSDNPEIAAEAAVALNAWMYVVSKLYEVVEDCKTSASSETSFNFMDTLDDDGGINALDQAAAIWLGYGQTMGQSDGYLLYTVAENIARPFGMNGFGQCKANAKIMSLMKDAKNRISLNNACSSQSDTPSKLKHVVDDIVSYMTVPLMQNLIKALVENDTSRIKLYALSVVPLIAGCSPSLYAYLNEKLIVTDQLMVSEEEEIISKLQSSFSCLGISCNDIGTYQGSGVECADPVIRNPLAGYIPSSDVREVSSSLSSFM